MTSKQAAELLGRTVFVRHEPTGWMVRGQVDDVRESFGRTDYRVLPELPTAGQGVWVSADRCVLVEVGADTVIAAVFGDDSVAASFAPQA
jgi:hypothetical protein